MIMKHDWMLPVDRLLWYSRKLVVTVFVKFGNFYRLYFMFYWDFCRECHHKEFVFAINFLYPCSLYSSFAVQIFLESQSVYIKICLTIFWKLYYNHDNIWFKISWGLLEPCGCEKCFAAKQPFSCGRNNNDEINSQKLVVVALSITCTS